MKSLIAADTSSRHVEPSLCRARSRLSPQALVTMRETASGIGRHGATPLPPPAPEQAEARSCHCDQPRTRAVEDLADQSKQAAETAFVMSVIQPRCRSPRQVADVTHGIASANPMMALNGRAGIEAGRGSRPHGHGEDAASCSATTRPLKSASRQRSRDRLFIFRQHPRSTTASPWVTGVRVFDSR
ncbi:MAG TPA: hypothetical protein VJ790_19600 [Dongiaceae bacterium]|nr:hypothetical protein [Dongiaceae bacterium]